MNAAPRRLRRRLFGPGPLEARVFFTPALVGLLVTGIWGLSVLQLSTTAWLPTPNAFAYLAIERTGPLSIQECGLVILVLLLTNFGVLLFGWLSEVRRFGWESYRPWRLVAGLWAALLIGLSLVVTIRFSSLPDEGKLIKDALADLRRGLPGSLRVALAHQVPAAKSACRELLGSDDLSVRLFAAAGLWRWDGRSEEMAEAARREMDMLAAQMVEDPGGSRLTRDFRGRIGHAFGEFRGEDWWFSFVPSIESFKGGGGIWRQWEEIEDRFLYKSAAENPTK
jgi:hypothetical protein